MLLETITGNLRHAYGQIQDGTMQHADDLTNERRTHPDKHERQTLRNQWFYTADGAVYFLDGACKTPILAITREANNPVLRGIDDAFIQLAQKHNYHLTRTDVDTALNAADTVLITLPDLRLSKCSRHNKEFRGLVVKTTPSKYNQLNDEERKLAERVYGQGDDFIQNMKMLRKAGISETSIYVLNPGYVRKHASEGVIARASWLNYFNNDSDFGANDSFIYDRNRIRGVRNKTEHKPFSVQDRLSL